MASTRGKLEAMITVPTGGWSLTCTDASSGPIQVTLPAGTYYHSSAGTGGTGTLDFEGELENVIDAAMTENWSITFSASTSGTRQYQISAAGGTCTVTWDSTDLRDLMGFTGNLSGSTSYTAPGRAQALWLSDYGWQSPCGVDGFDGFPETDKQDAENAAGYLYSVTGQTKYINALTFPMESLDNSIRAAETYANESFQSFVEQAIHGTKAWASSGGPIRWYPDADDVATYYDYYVPGFQNWTPARLREDKQWDQYWTINIPRLVKVPA